MYKLEFELTNHPEAHHFIVNINYEVNDIKLEIKEQTKYWKGVFNTPIKCVKYKKI